MCWLKPLLRPSTDLLFLVAPDFRPWQIKVTAKPCLYGQILFLCSVGVWLALLFLIHEHVLVELMDHIGSIQSIVSRKSC